MARSGKGNKAIRKTIYRFKKISNIKIYSKTTITQKQTKRERTEENKNKNKTKKKRKKETGSTLNRAQDLPHARPFRYHYTT